MGEGSGFSEERPAVSKGASLLLDLASYGTVTVALLGSVATLSPPVSWRLWFLAAVFSLFYAFQIKVDWWARTPLRAAVFLAGQAILAVAVGLGQGRYGGFYWFILLFFMLASQAFFLLRPPQALAASGLLYLTALGTLYWVVRPQTPQGILQMAGALLSGFVFVVAMSYLAVQQGRERARSERALKELQLSQSQLQEAHRRLAAYAREVEELAATRERNRLASEIHDTLAHALTALVVQLEGCQCLWEVDPRRAREHLQRSQELARRGLAEVRRSLRALHSDLSGQRPCAQALAELAREFEADTGMEVSFQICGQERAVRPEVSTTLYRALQEALTNSGQHGRARRVTATLLFLPGELRLAVADDGRGAEQVIPGLGLTGMRERVEELKGRLQISTRPGKGFTLIISLPDP